MKIKTAILGISLAALLSLWLLYRVLFPDGVGPSGAFDDEGGEGDQGMGTNDNPDGTRYKDAPFKLEHFDVREFESPDAPGSGGMMRTSTLQMLDQARTIAGIPFVISDGGGYRTPAYNESLRPRSAKNSAHLGGWAADIRARDVATQRAIVRALKQAGFRRFGIYKTFIHADNDPSKTQNVAWQGDKKGYPQGSDFVALDFPFDPFTV